MPSVRGCQELSLCPTGSEPAGSEMDPLPAKAEPASDSEGRGEAGCPPETHEGPPGALEDPYAGAGGCSKQAVVWWEGNAGAGSLQDLWSHKTRSPC